MKELGIKEYLKEIPHHMFQLIIALLMGLFFSWLTGLVIKTSEPVPHDWHRIAGFIVGSVYYLFSLIHDDRYEFELERDRRILEYAEARKKELDV